MSNEVIDKELERLHDLVKFDKLTEEQREEIVNMIVKIVDQLTTGQIYIPTIIGQPTFFSTLTQVGGGSITSFNPELHNNSDTTLNDIPTSLNIPIYDENMGYGGCFIP